MNDTAASSPSPPAPRPPATSIGEVIGQALAKLADSCRATHAAVFLYNDATRLLVLRGAIGSPFGNDPVGRFHIQPGDGMAGAAFAERAPLHSGHIQSEPGHLPPEHLFGVSLGGPCAEAAIPVLRGEEAVGVVVLLRPATEPFSPAEINDLRANVARRAGTLEFAKALYMVADRDADRPRSDRVSSARHTVHGTALHDRATVAGLSLVATRESVADLLVAIRERQRPLPAPARSFDEGVALTIDQLTRYQDEIGERLPEAAKLLFDAQILILKDETFVGRIAKAVAAGDDISHAIADVTVEFTTFFRSGGVEFLAEKALDVEDVALRLLHNIYLTEAQSPSEPRSPEQPESGNGPGETSPGRILFSSECLPSDIFRVMHEGIRGLVLLGAGATAHITLLVKSLGIPTILADDLDLLRLPDGTPVVLNGPTGDILVNPGPDVLRHVESATFQHSGPAGTASGNPDFPTSRPPQVPLTRDGERVHLLANINLLSETDAALAARAEGVGLYRTEFPFLLHPFLPNEQDQTEIYGKLLDRFPDRPVVFRTLDAGGDKVLSYFQTSREENPALGLRSTRFTLRYPYIFDQQLRAILRAAQLRGRTDLRLMFPMIGSLEEFDAAVRRVDHCLAHFAERYEAATPPPRPALGTMVELPSLVPLARALARRAAFFSIGTNDFIQYMLAVDRTNAAVRRYYVPHHPAVLHGLAQVISAGLDAGIPVAVCGEMGRDPRYLPFFLGLGVRTFSLAPAEIPAVQAALADISAAEARHAAAALLACETIADIERLLPAAPSRQVP